MKKDNWLLRIVNFNPLVSKREGKFNIIGEGGYRFNRHIFQITLIIIVVLILYVMNTYGFDFNTKIYYKCEEPNSCLNPFNVNNLESPLPYDDKILCTYEWCNDEYLPYGFEFGKKPTLLYKSIGPISFTLFFLALLLNHFLYNKNKLQFLNNDEEREI